MSLAIRYCYHNMIAEQFDDMRVIDERNYLASCPLVDYVRASAPADVHPLFERAREYRYDSTWFMAPVGQHVAEIRKRGVPRVIFHGNWFERFKHVVTGEFEAT